MPLTIAGKLIGPIGLGMMSLSYPHKPTSDPDAILILKSALEAGCNFWDAGMFYGTPERNSLHILHAYFSKYPEDAERVVVSVKGCLDMKTKKLRNDSAGVRESIELALGILDGKCRIDVFQPCRVDPEVGIEETVGAIAEFVKEGRIGGVGLSECGAASLRRAVAVHPLAAVEVELSLFSRDILSNGVAEACKETNTPIVAYSPLGKGFLTGQFKTLDDIPQDDIVRRMAPRFAPEAFEHNMRFVERVERIAGKKGCTVGQVAIAWVAAQSEVIGVPVVPIPGTSSVERMRENVDCVRLSEEELGALGEVVSGVEVKGARAPAGWAKYLAA